MKFETAERISSLNESVFTDLLHEKLRYEQRTGQKVLDFTLGSPDIPPSQAVIETLCSAAAKPENYRYAIAPLPALVAEIQAFYKKRYQVDLDADEICLLQGSQEALINLPLLYCNPGDGILISDPYYPAYRDAPAIAQADILYVPLKEENDWLWDFDAIDEETRRKAKMMIVCYPNNPTGAAAPDWFVEKLIAFARKYQILVVYDSAYIDLVFDGKPARSFLSFEGAREAGIELNSFSKSYGMAGARLGIMAGSKDVIAAYKSLKSNMDYGIFLPVQYAGIAALSQGAPVVEKTRSIYQHRRALLKESFEKAGWDISLPEATMFVWARIPQTYPDSTAFARALLKECGVMVTPGTAFGKEGDRYVRLALVCSDQTIEEAAKRMRAAGFFG